MAKRSVKIRVGYILTSSSNWIGGFNYIKNLFENPENPNKESVDAYCKIHNKE
jgi:hypothetical protein